MNSLLNYIKIIEGKLSDSESLEEQYLNFDIYNHKNFNLKSFSLNIMNKVQNTTNLINNLKKFIEQIKNDIVEQINSNYTNYVILISKLQMIDFLIDNIQENLNFIKNKINQKLEIIDNYENEFKQILSFLLESDNEISIIYKEITNYKNNIKLKKLNLQIKNFIENNKIEINNFNYSIIRHFLFLLNDYYGINTNILNKEDDFNIYINNIFNNFGNKYFNNKNNEKKENISTKINLNILSLLNMIFINQKNEKDFYKEIYNKFLKEKIITILESNLSLKNKINKIIELMNEKFILDFNNIIKNNEFNIICFLKPTFNQLLQEKFYFNCSEPFVFKENYISILNFIKLFYLDENDNLYIKNILQNFSFFTYYQYIENEISSNFVQLFNTNNVKNLNNFSNILFNYIKTLKDLFLEKKLFIKNIPNFLNFIIKANLLLVNKFKEYENDKSLNNNIYKENYNLFLDYFNYEKGEFRKNIIEIIFEREKFFFYSNDEIDEFKENLNLICLSINNNLN